MQPWQPMPPLAPTAPPGRTAAGRPGSVTAAAMLLMLAVLLDLAEVGVVAMGMTAQSAHDKAQGADSSDIKFLTISFIVLIAINVVLAFGLTGGALAVLRRRMSGLVLALVFGCFAMLLRCGCGGTGGWAWYYDTHTDGVSPDPYPSWLYVADISIDVVALIAILTAIILLLTGTSRRWLRGAR
jgi:hypothetical protein